MKTSNPLVISEPEYRALLSLRIRAQSVIDLAHFYAIDGNHIPKDLSQRLAQLNDALADYEAAIEAGTGSAGPSRQTGELQEEKVI